MIAPAQDGPGMGSFIYAFGRFRLDPRQRVLWHDLERVSLTPKAFEVLLALVESPGRLVTRDELLHKVWADSVVEESNVTQTVFVLRNALGRDVDERCIVTIPGSGYRFVAEVTRLEDEPAPADSLVPTEVSLRRGIGAKRWALVGGMLAVVMSIAFVAYWRGNASSGLAPEPGARKMLAVLPFQNLTGDAGQEYLSDGLTEEMIAQIGRLDPRDLGVIARTSVMHYKQTGTPLAQIGRDLQVQYVLEGSVRRDSDKVRVTAQLVQVSDQSRLWTREYDREPSHLLALELGVAQDVAEEVHLTFGHDESAAAASQSDPSPNASKAYDEYLRGRYAWNKRTPEGFEEAIGHFEESIALEPGNARAYAGLADCYVLLPGYKMVPQAVYMEKAKAAAMQALRFDEGLAEAHTSLALIVENSEWDWPKAEKEYVRAIELNPNYATAHHWYAECLAWEGRFAEALGESERARVLDPLSLIIAADNGMILYYSRQYQRAEKRLNSVLALDPGFPRAHMVRHVYAMEGQFGPALADIETFGADQTPWDLANVLGRAGRLAEANVALEKLRQRNERQPVDPAAIAWAYVGVGDNEQALAWLERGYAEHSNMLTSLKVDPGWDRLRTEPRFQDLLHRLRLDDVAQAVAKGTPRPPA